MRLIDADALIKDIDYSADMGGALGKVVECVKYYAKYMVASAPTIEPKKGKWVSDRLVTTNGGTYGVRRCSECEAYYQDVGYGWHYCPNCGARMEDE